MKKIILFLGIINTFLLCSNLSSAKQFTDIKEDNTLYTASRYLSAKGIINGYDDGTFKPDQNITRAELLKIIFEGNKTPTTNPTTNCFSDVGYQEWYSKYICTAKNSNIIRGYDDGTFKPDQTVNKAEALKILGEFYKWKTIENKTDAWYSKYINFGEKKGFIKNYDNFLPGEDMSRGEISDILYKFLATEEYKTDTFTDDLDNKIAIKIYNEDSNSANEQQDETSKVISRNLPSPQIFQLAPGEIKIVFGWEMPPIPPEQKKTEFNSYLIEPTDEEISYTHKIDSKVDTIMETTANSQTFTILNLKADVKEKAQIKDYLFFAESINGQTTFNDAKAKIEIYDKNGLAKTILAYPNTDRIWKIFTLDENYEMRIFNSIETCDQINRKSTSCPQVPGE